MTIQPDEYQASLIQMAKAIDDVHITLESDGFIAESPNRTIGIKLNQPLTSQTMRLAIGILRRRALEAA